ncbi:UNVERIFIED_CONTAM: hypothetical protein PYX00_004680 [Menopon gallinae]|uniref:NADP-dependent oxidoreductase domain-containing protein n=1 Tax=Menopon gallinae TaxID=328185 RepID=A0AAW2I690_9NEOP
MALPRTYTEGFHNLEDVRKMKYVNLGTTGMKVSVLGFGGGCFGNHYGDYDVEDAKKVVHEALRRGVNYIDTAPFYGEGKSEKTLGEALRNVPRSAYYIATKVARYSLDPTRAFDFSYGNVLKSVNESLQRLGLDYVDIIQVHDVEFAPSVDIIINQTLPALYEVVRDGKARFIGVTGYPLSVLKEVIEKSPVKIDCVLSYSRLTLMDDTLKDYIPFFKSKDLGIIHASPPALGLLTNCGSWDWHPGNALYRELCGKAAQFCKENGVELGNLAVYYTMSQPDVDVHLVGMPTMSHLESNLSVALNSITQKEKDVLNEIFKRYVERRVLTKTL